MRGDQELLLSNICQCSDEWPRLGSLSIYHKGHVCALLVLRNFYSFLADWQDQRPCILGFLLLPILSVLLSA